jgi:hypothetical protein
MAEVNGEHGLIINHLKEIREDLRQMRTEALVTKTARDEQIEGIHARIAAVRGETVGVNEFRDYKEGVETARVECQGRWLDKRSFLVGIGVIGAVEPVLLFLVARAFV